METTIRISIENKSFSLTTSAYRTLKKRIEQETASLSAELRPDVIAQIEHKFAEYIGYSGMDSDRLFSKDDVITILNAIGLTTLQSDAEPEPEDFEFGAEDTNANDERQTETRQNTTSQNDTAYSYAPPIKRPLYRNPQQSVICGVCGGIADWLDVGVVWVRLAMLLLALTFYGILIYLVLWLILPEKPGARQFASTTAQADIHLDSDARQQSNSGCGKGGCLLLLLCIILLIPLTLAGFAILKHILHTILLF